MPKPIPVEEVGGAAARTGGRLQRRQAVLDFQVVDGVPTSLGAYLDSLERDAIRCALAKTRYNRTAAAQLLGITFRQLRYRMQRLGIK